MEHGEKEKMHQALENLQNTILNHQTKQFQEQNNKIAQLEKLVTQLISHSQKEEVSQPTLIGDLVLSVVESKMAILMAKLDAKISALLQKTEHYLEEQTSKFDRRIEDLQKKLDEQFRSMFECAESIEKHLNSIQSSLVHQEKPDSQPLEKSKLTEADQDQLKKLNELTFETVLCSLRKDLEFVWNSSLLMSIDIDENKSIRQARFLKNLNALSKFPEPPLQNRSYSIPTFMSILQIEYLSVSSWKH